MPILKEKTFDVIYVDGSHAYTQVLSDLNNALKLIKDDGFICGDDLELQYSEVNKQVLLDNKEIDTICDPKTNEIYHPGVTLALHDFNKKINIEKGFWWVSIKECLQVS